MRISTHTANSNTFLRLGDFVVHQRLQHLIFIVVIPPTHPRLSRIRIRLIRFPPQLPRLILPTSPNFILMHRLQRPTHPQKQAHQFPLRELRPIHQVRIYHILQIPSPIIRQKNIHRFRTRVRSIGLDTVINRFDDIPVPLEKRVRFYLFHSLRYAFLTKGTSDLLERVQCFVGSVLYEVDIGEATFAEEA